MRGRLRSRAPALALALAAACGAPAGTGATALLARQEAEGWAVDSPAGELAWHSDCDVPPVAPGALATLAADLAPRDPRWAPWARDALLVAPSRAPRPGSGIRPLAEVVRAHCTLDMRVAHARGRALAELLAVAPPSVALVLDLPGPEAVAIAAALAGRYEPVLTFESWPHPRGAVPAHLTLGAVLYWRDALVAAAASRPTPAPPAFVLDSARTTPPLDAADNGYAVELPTAADLRAAGIARILLVRGRSSDGASADLDRALGELHWTAGIPVALVALQDLHTVDEVPELPGDPGAMTWYWGGTRETHGYFAVAYGLGEPPQPAVAPPAVGIPWTPTRPPGAP